MAIQQRILLFFCFIIALVFSIKSMSEPDIWWQLATGEWIVKNGKVPSVDMLSYTFAGEPWVNIKWGSEVLFYYFSQCFSVELIPFFVGILYLILFFILIKIIQLRDEFVINNGFILCALLFIISIAHRINGRPEIFSYLFSAIYLWIFYRAAQHPKIIYLLIPLQCLWTNMHEGFGVGMAMIIIWALSSYIESKKINLMQVSVLIISFLIMALNPINIKIYSYAINIFGQLKSNTFTTELSSFTSSDYWNIYAVFNLITMIMSGNQLLKWLMKDRWNGMSKHIPLFHLLIWLAFAYLSLQSNRNIVYFQIASFPIYFALFKRNESKQFWISYVLIVIVYWSVVSNKFYEKFDTHHQYGLSISPEKTPIGSAQFISPYKGKGFTDFFSSNYLLWANRPQFKSYLDLRDLDVFTPAFYKNCLVLMQRPDTRVSATQTIWELADSVDQFQYIVLLNNPDFIPLHQYLNRGNTFYRAYFDPLASVYLRGNKTEHPKVAMSNYAQYPSHPLSNIINKLFNPMYIDLDKRSYPYRDYENYILGEFN